MLTEAYLCLSHGVFEADPVTGGLVHLDTERCWHPWQGNWYQQHRNPEGLKIEVYQALDHLHYQGFRAVKLTLARRYESLVQPHLDRTNALTEITPNVQESYPNSGCSRMNCRATS